MNDNEVPTFAELIKELTRLEPESPEALMTYVYMMKLIIESATEIVPVDEITRRDVGMIMVAHGATGDLVVAHGEVIFTLIMKTAEAYGTVQALLQGDPWGMQHRRN